MMIEIDASLHQLGEKRALIYLVVGGRPRKDHGPQSPSSPM